jgi:hypothetical protein
MKLRQPQPQPVAEPEDNVASGESLLSDDDF